MSLEECSSLMSVSDRKSSPTYDVNILNALWEVVPTANGR